MWVYQWGLACCAIEMGAAFGSPRYDVMRLGVIPFPASPRQADRGASSPARSPTRWRRPSAASTSRCPTPSTSSPWAPAPTAAARTGTRYSVHQGHRPDHPVDVYVPGLPAAGPRPCSRASCCCRSASSNEDMAERWRGDPIVVDMTPQRPRRPSRTTPTRRPPRRSAPREAMVELRSPSSGRRRDRAPHPPRRGRLGPGRSRTPGRRPAEAARDRLGCTLLLLPVGHRLDAVAVRPLHRLRGRPGASRTAPTTASPTAGPGLRRRRHPLPGVRPGRNVTRALGHHLQGRRADEDLVDRDLDGSTPAPTGTSVSLRDVRHRLRGPPRSRHIYLPGEFEGYPLRKDFPLLARGW